MRIAVVTSALPADTGGGAEGYAAELARALAGRHDVWILTGSRDRGPAGLPIVRLPESPSFRPSAGIAHKLAWHARDQWRPSIFASARRALVAIAPDIVHSHNAQGLSAAVFSAIGRARIPHVHTVHDFNLLCARVTMTRDGVPCGGGCAACRVQRIVRIASVRGQLAMLIAPSDFARRVHIAFGVVPEERATTIRHGALASVAAVRGAGERVRFGYMGTLAQHKGIGTLLEALDGLTGRWRLDVAGQGPLTSAVERAAAARAEVHVHGYLDGDAKEAFLGGLDVLVVPSEWAENAPLVLVEAAVRGIPAIVSDRGGLPETAHSWVVPARDVRALRDQLQRLVTSPEQVTQHSRALISDRARFSWDSHVERVERVLADAAGSDHRAVRSGPLGVSGCD